MSNTENFGTFMAAFIISIKRTKNIAHDKKNNNKGMNKYTKKIQMYIFITTKYIKK